MPNSEAKRTSYQKWYTEHRDKQLEYFRKYNQKRTFSMRCPKCGKHIKNIRQSYAHARSLVTCKHCGSRVRIKKVLNESIKHPKGLKLELAEDLLGTIFTFIKEHPHTYFSEICEQTQISPQRARSRIDILTENGYITSVKDKQIKRLTLTQKGHWLNGPVII